MSRKAASTVSLNVVLDEPDRPSWTSGETITGSVILISTSEEAITAITVSLLGRAKAEIYGDSELDPLQLPNGGLKSEAALIDRVQGLLSSQEIIQSREYKWPFSFTLPDTPDETVGNLWVRHHEFRGNSEHLLPPTMSFLSLGRLGKAEFICGIDYILEARVTRPSAGQSLLKRRKDIVAKKHINFEPVLAQSVPSPTDVLWHDASFTVKSTMLDPANSNRNRLGERVRTRLTSDSSLPSARFGVHISHATAICPGTPLNIEIRLNYDHEQSTAPVRPTAIATVSARIIQKTGVRTPSGDHLIYDLATTTTVLNHSSGSHNFSKATDYTCHIVTERLDTTRIQPAFATFNIVQDYQLQITCIFRCGGKTEQVVINSAIAILPASAGLMGAGGYAAGVSGDRHDSLPAYSAA